MSLQVSLEFEPILEHGEISDIGSRADGLVNPGLVGPHVCQEAGRADPDAASPSMRPPWRDAILQPPAPQITPSAEILRLAAEHDIEPEAGG